jgi:hypothetical protein
MLCDITVIKKYKQQQISKVLIFKKKLHVSGLTGPSSGSTAVQKQTYSTVLSS